MQSVFLLYMISGVTILMGIYGPPQTNTNSHCGGIPGYKYISMQQCWIDLLAFINIMAEWMNKTHRRSETGVCNPGAASSLRAQGSHSLSLQGPVSLTHTYKHTHVCQGVEWGTMEGLEWSFTDIHSHTHTGAQWHAYAHAHIHRQLSGAVNEPPSLTSLSLFSLSSLSP